ncbi:unnamed protein product, partial [Polarella glacialis]
DHVKRWGNWEWYKDDVTKQKLLLHPELQGGQSRRPALPAAPPTAAPWAPAAPPTAAPWATPPSQQAAQPKAAPWGPPAQSGQPYHNPQAPVSMPMPPPQVGANLFIGNLEPEVDEKMLYDTFSAFGVLLFAKVMRDPDTGASRGFGFISYDSFEGSDAALAGMNGQFLCNRPISASYAYKKETKGERHGSAAERLIAANRPSDLPKGPGAAPAKGGGKGGPPGMPSMRPPMLPPGMPPPPGMGMGGPAPGMPRY